MTKDEIYLQLTEVFHEIFDDPMLTLSPEMTADQVEGWDSFNHINLIVAIETRFGIKFKTTELESLRDVGQLVEVIFTKLAGRR